MAGDTPIKESGTPVADAVAAAAPEKPELSQAVGVMEAIMTLLHRIDKKVDGLPTPQAFNEQWGTQSDLYQQVQERFKLDEESRALLKIHIGDMADLRKLQLASNEKTEKLATAQDRLAESLEHINDNLKTGFDLGNAVVKLFGRITLTFLAAIVVLSLVIIWIAKIDAHKDGAKWDIRSGNAQQRESAAPAPAPVVDFTPTPVPVE